MSQPSGLGTELQAGLAAVFNRRSETVSCLASLCSSLESLFIVASYTVIAGIAFGKLL